MDGIIAVVDQIHHFRHCPGEVCLIREQLRRADLFCGKTQLQEEEGGEIVPILGRVVAMHARVFLKNTFSKEN